MPLNEPVSEILTLDQNMHWNARGVVLCCNHCLNEPAAILNHHQAALVAGSRLLLPLAVKGFVRRDVGSAYGLVSISSPVQTWVRHSRSRLLIRVDHMCMCAGRWLESVRMGSMFRQINCRSQVKPPIPNTYDMTRFDPKWSAARLPYQRNDGGVPAAQ